MTSDYTIHLCNQLSRHRAHVPYVTSVLNPGQNGQNVYKLATSEHTNGTKMGQTADHCFTLTARGGQCSKHENLLHSSGLSTRSASLPVTTTPPNSYALRLWSAKTSFCRWQCI